MVFQISLIPDSSDLTYWWNVSIQDGCIRPFNKRSMSIYSVSGTVLDIMHIEMNEGSLSTHTLVQETDNKDHDRVI